MKQTAKMSVGRREQACRVRAAGKSGNGNPHVGTVSTGGAEMGQKGTSTAIMTVS